MPDRRIFHIALQSELEPGLAGGSYAPRAFADEGFIHCSYAGQVCAVAERLYRNEAGLVLVEIDRNLTGCRVVDEDLYGAGQAYPHIYGKLVAAAVVAVHEFPGPASGASRFELPPTVETDNRA